MLTVAEVKRDLPRVKVKIGRKVHFARITGRLNPFATVSLNYIEHSHPREYLRGPCWIDWQYSWEAVTSAINQDVPLEP